MICQILTTNIPSIKEKSRQLINILIKAVSEGDNKFTISSIANLDDITTIEYRVALEDIVEALHLGSFHHEAHQLEIKLNSII